MIDGKRARKIWGGQKSIITHAIVEQAIFNGEIIENKITSKIKQKRIYIYYY